MLARRSGGALEGESCEITALTSGQGRPGTAIRSSKFTRAKQTAATVSAGGGVPWLRPPGT